MVREIVDNFLPDTSNRRITLEVPASVKAAAKVKSDKPKKAPRKRAPKKAASADDSLVGQPCPVCGKGTIIKGKTAYGCSEWRNGCTYRKPFGEG